MLPLPLPSCHKDRFDPDAAFIFALIKRNRFDPDAGFVFAFVPS